MPIGVGKEARVTPVQGNAPGGIASILGGEQAMSRQLEGQRHQGRMAELQHEQGLEKMVAGSILEQEGFENRLTAKQKMEDDRLAEAEAAIMSDESFSEAEKQEAIRRIRARRAGIQPLPQRKETPKWGEGKGIGDVWTDDKSGTIFTRDKEGQVKKLGDSGPSFADIAKTREMAYKYLTKKTEDGTETPPTRDEVDAEVERVLGTTRARGAGVATEGVAGKFGGPEAPPGAIYPQQLPGEQAQPAQQETAPVGQPAMDTSGIPSGPPEQAPWTREWVKNVAREYGVKEKPRPGSKIKEGGFEYIDRIYDEYESARNEAMQFTGTDPRRKSATARALKAFHKIEGHVKSWQTRTTMKIDEKIKGLPDQKKLTELIAAKGVDEKTKALILEEYKKAKDKRLSSKERKQYLDKTLAWLSELEAGTQMARNR